MKIGGEGKLSEPNDGYAEFDIPYDILITTFYDPFEAIVQITYSIFFENYHSYDYLRSRAIIGATIERFEQINEHVLATMPGYG